jgi:DNA-directed RNA polymerase subunit RPC12/RpoP
MITELFFSDLTITPMGDTNDTSFSSTSSESPGSVNSYNRIQMSRMSQNSNSHQYKSRSSPSYSNSSRSSESSSSAGLQVSSSSKQSAGKKLKKQHVVKVKYKCEMCGKKVMNMRGHVKRMHEGQGEANRITCGQCDKTILQSNLGRHVLEYHMEEEESVSPPLVSDEDSNPVEFQSNPPVNNKKSQRVSMTDLANKEPPSEVTGIDNSAVVNDEVSDSASGHQKKKQVLPRLSRMFNRDIVVDLNHNTVEKGDTVLATVDDKVMNDSRIHNVVKNMETIHFWIKTKDRDLEGEQVRSLKIKMAPFRTIGRAKRSYSDKLDLDKNKQEELQFMLEGRMLEDEEEVGMLDNKTIFAAGLWFSA